MWKGCPSSQISPAVGSINRSRHRERVVFPHPLSPTSPSVLPVGILKETSETAWTVPLFIPSNPCLTGKFLVRFFTASSGGDVGEAVGWLGVSSRVFTIEMAFD